MRNFRDLRSWMAMQGGPDVEDHAHIKISTESGPKVLILPDGSECLTKGGAFEDVLEALVGSPPLEPQPGEPSDDVSTAILAGSIGSIQKALATGEHDADLGALAAAEIAGANRKGALAAITARQVIVDEKSA